ncbi:MAG: hypothetical protein QME59_07090 [Candidatus Hydrothermarchaeota archaeon]|nr:hypothetical protein [Candidatus Hydrothermarchaeota archaeon]
MGEEVFSKCGRESILFKMDYYKSTPRVLAFGYATGSLMSRIACIDKENSREPVVLASLFNLLISLFDRICDGRPDLYPLLVKGAPKEAMERVMERADGNNFPLNSDNTALTVIFRLMEGYSRGLRELHALSGNIEVWEELKKSVLLMYDSEVSSRELKFEGKHKVEDIYDALRNARSLPGWSICLTALLSPSARKIKDFKGLKEDMLKIGDIFWILDDIVDTVEDLEERRWSYTWLKLNNRIELVDERGNLLPKERLLSEMINSDVVSKTAESICSNYLEARDEYQKFFEREEDFKIPVLSWIKSWINAL